MKKYFLALPFLAFALMPYPSLAANKVSLPVPFLWEIPDGVWVSPWRGACEEASMSMVNQYYLHNAKLSFSAAQAKKIMQPLFGIEDKLFGYNSDTNAAEIQKVVNGNLAYDAAIKLNPTLAEIKSELDAARPVIGLFYGYGLKNPLHRFRQGSSSYHVMVIVGYDDSAQEFLINDPELSNGIDFRYKYDTILSTLHDFSHLTKHADGAATVLFTSAKQIVKAKNSSRIYLVKDGVRRYITSPGVFKNHGWSWSLVQTVNTSTLFAYPAGNDITI